MTGEAVSLTSRTYRYNHHLVLIFALLFLVSSSPETVAGEAAASPTACKVTINDKDMTDELFVVDNSYENDNNENDDDKERRYVNCMGRSKCRDAIITNCPRIKCYESEACNNARIINFTESVLCEGTHSCHRTNMTLAAETTEETTKTKVSCIGSEACDVAQITGEIDEIEFVGVKAGRKVHVEDAKVIKCRDGTDNNRACDSLATFLNVRCLYCGQNGCSDHVNTCRYKFAAPPSSASEEEDNDDDTNDSSWMQYEKCKPEKVLGPNCPAGLENELRMELMGKEEIEVVGLSSEEKEEGDDDGRKKKKRGIRGLLRRGSSD